MTDTHALADQFGRLSIRLHRAVDQAMRAEGVSLAKTKLLVYIQRNGPSRARDIADFFGFAPRTVTEGIDGLEREGLIAREPDPEDRRAKRIVLTDAGREAIQRSKGPRDFVIGHVLGALDDEERDRLLLTLAKMEQQLEGLATGGGPDSGPAGCGVDAAA